MGNNLFQDYVDDYLRGAQLTLSSHNSYRDSLNLYWLPALNDQKIYTISYRTLRQLDSSIEWPSQKTRKNAIAALRGVFTLAYDDALLPVNTSPAHQLRFKKHQKPAPDPFTTIERTRILAWMKTRAPPIHGRYFRIAFGTGMRTGELLALNWDSLSGNQLKIHHSMVRGQHKDTKTSAERMVLLPNWLAEELAQSPDRSEEGYVFKNQYGRPYKSGYHLNRVFRQCLADLKIKSRTGPYPWRHTYASCGLTAGLEPAFLARQLGHNLETFYSHYARWIQGDRDQQQMDKLEGSWGVC